eukprot:TRINITY_DN5607_c0_g1_i1.p1 TRINITY_DN5607_c0_g1~~TRINITY_DN5607_c0_g1_i1.p1  ORF type:complete len:222 (-),score=38.72 TRINITY_DN5607_c0_g1_i1:297-962(-)
MALREGALVVDVKLREAEGVGISGTTATFSLITQKYITTANIGDSRTVLMTGGATKEMSTDHKPCNESERQRIKAAGGKVWISSGCYRVMGDLAVSRALGDFRFKQNLGRGQLGQIVSPEPDLEVHHSTLGASSSSPYPNNHHVEVHERTEQDEFLVLACDGIWDVMTSQEVTKFLNLELQYVEPGQACGHLIQKCLEKNSRDNMSVALIKFPLGKTQVSL